MSKKPIDNAVSHFSGLQTRVIKVEEWGDDKDPLEIYVTPFTLHEKGDCLPKEMYLMLMPLLTYL